MLLYLDLKNIFCYFPTLFERRYGTNNFYYLLLSPQLLSLLRLTEVMKLHGKGATPLSA